MHLRLVSRAASWRLGILSKFWRVFHDRSLLDRCFRGFVLSVLEYCSAVWCPAADTHLKLLDRAVSGARFLTGGVFEFAVLCMLYKIRCNPMHPLNDELCGPCVPVWVTHSALVAHRYTYAQPRSTAGLLFSFQCPYETILLTPYSMVWDWQVSRAGPMLYWPKLLYPYFSLALFFSFSS